MEVQDQRFKKRVRRPPEFWMKLIDEVEKSGNARTVLQREGINPTVYYRARARAREGALEALKDIWGRRKKDPVVVGLEREIERLKAALVEQSIENARLKKNENGI